MRKAPILFLLVAGCGGPPAREPAQTATLTGLYRTGDGDRPASRLCIVSRDGEERFGLATWSEGRPHCSGAGVATRRGDRLSLTMAGEGACTIEARLEGRILTFPASLPPGCSYYCAPGASLVRRRFEKVGGTEADARGARDLVGDPLCD